MKKLEDLGISPFPWEVRNTYPMNEGGDRPNGKWLVDDDGNDLILDIDGDGIDGITANAHLVAASPELYAAALNALKFLESGTLTVNTGYEEGCVDGVCMQLRSALEKASEYESAEDYE